MGNENDYEAGHVMSYHDYHISSDNKDPAQFSLGTCTIFPESSLFAHFKHEALFCLFCC